MKKTVGQKLKLKLWFLVKTETETGRLLGEPKRYNDIHDR